VQIIDQVNVRDLEKDDINFLFNSFINCLSKYKESFFNGWEHKDITEYLEYLFIWALNHGQYSVFIACNKSDSTQIIAYIISNPSTNEIFFQYTKYDYRKLGIQKYILIPLALDNTKEIICNWATKEMKKLSKQSKVTIKPQFIYNLMKAVSQ
jgi:hypothetical protein